MKTRKDNKAILVQFIEEIWNRGKINSVDEFIAPIYIIKHDPGDPWDQKELDIEGYKERVLLSRAPFPDQNFDIQELIEEGNAIVMTWFWKASHQGDIAGFPATGRQISMSGITVYYFNEQHRITGHWQITDRIGVFQQLSANQSS